MSDWLEIVIPLRNPGDKLFDTIQSICEQELRDFGVILSDNHSTTGNEHIEHAKHLLESARVKVRIVRPRVSLGRVEHWNWAHGEASAKWIKPLFVGDWIQPQYTAELRRRAFGNSRPKIVRCELETRFADGSFWVTKSPAQRNYLGPSEFLNWYPHLGNWIGGPANLAYERDAWRATGGFSVQYPVCADLRLTLLLILRHGMETISSPLAVFQMHGQRFSHQLIKRRVNGLFEFWLILREVRSYAQTLKLPWSSSAIPAALIRQFQVDYFDPFKRRLRARILG